MSIIDRVNWSKLDRIVAVHQRNRETYAPVISLFRWWARRPHVVAGALLEAARQQFRSDSILVADPFSGGGTVAFEAVRQGLPVYAQDLHPWATFGLSTSLSHASAREIRLAALGILNKIESFRSLYRVETPGRTAELTHILRVRVASCPECGGHLYLYRNSLVSLASRKSEERMAFFGCGACGAASKRPRESESFKCDQCGQRSRVANRKGSIPIPVESCAHCGTTSPLEELLAAPVRWHPFLVQEHCSDRVGTAHVHLRVPRASDPIQDCAKSACERKLSVPIREGIETSHLLRSGFRTWNDLYTHRQIQTILAALGEVDKLDCPLPIRLRLRLAILGAAEMPGFLCRWSRTHPKAFEALANHRYSRSTVVAETNLLSPIGRGTLPRRFLAAERGAAWLEQQRPCRSMITRKSTAVRRRFSGKTMIVTGSSSRQILAGRIVRLVLTDPPYYDDVQYGELARLFHTWLRAADRVALPNERDEAVPNRIRKSDQEDYERIVRSCLRESRRTMSKDGRLILTFHNNETTAWSSLGKVLRDAGFVIVALSTVSSENRTDHAKRGKRVFACDLVVECIARLRTSRRSHGIRVYGATRSNERRNLLAMGRALGRIVNGGSKDHIHDLYEAQARRLGAKSLLIHR